MDSPFLGSSSKVYLKLPSLSTMTSFPSTLPSASVICTVRPTAALPVTTASVRLISVGAPSALGASPLLDEEELPLLCTATAPPPTASTAKPNIAQSGIFSKAPEAISAPASSAAISVKLNSAVIGSNWPRHNTPCSSFNTSSLISSSSPNSVKKFSIVTTSPEFRLISRSTPSVLYAWTSIGPKGICTALTPSKVTVFAQSKEDTSPFTFFTTPIDLPSIIVFPLK